MHNINWNLLRYALFTYRKGSASKASEVLNVTHATVIRSLKKLEEESGVRLFNKSSTGYSATPHGKSLIETAEKIESMIYQWERSVSSDQGSPSGVLKITTTEAVMNYLICPYIHKFYEQFPEIELSLTTSDDFKNISNYEYDIAIRSTPEPPEHLIGRKVFNVDWCTYAAHDCDQDTNHWIGYSNTSQLPARWMVELYPSAKISLKASSIVSMVAATKNGLGKALLPSFIGAHEKDLLELERLDRQYSTELWMLYHKEARGCANTQAFTHWFYQMFGSSI